MTQSNGLPYSSKRIQAQISPNVPIHLKPLSLTLPLPKANIFSSKLQAAIPINTTKEFLHRHKLISPLKTDIPIPQTKFQYLVEMNLLSCSSSHRGLSSGFLASTDSSSKVFKNSFGVSQLGQELRRGYPRKNRQLCRVVGYYGLRSPPYKLDALEPYMSQRTLEVHWGAHHRNYVEALNQQLGKNDILYGYTMDELIKVTYNNGNPSPEFSNAAQVWNHDFFWESMRPGGGDMPTSGLLRQIEKDFGSYENFKEKFIETALTVCGSGWVWLVLKREKKCLAIVKTSNAVNPLVWNDIPIIGLDMWEHAYYLDYKNDKAKYANTFMNHLVSWDAAAARLARAQAFVNLGEPKIPVA